MTTGSFLYCACQAGAEAALKLGVTAEHPSLRPAFGRPGLVTFKAPSPLPGPVLRVASPLARVWGISLGPARGVEELLATLAGPATAAALAALGGHPGEPLRLHVWERDRWQPGHEPPGFVYGPAAAIVRATIVAAWSVSAHVLAEGELAGIGELVLDVILGEEGEPWIVGLRRRHARDVPFPGGRIPVPRPEHVPSRAYFKLEEALAWSRAPVRAGDVAVELGSAPGGASWALLERGVEVHGIDNGEMDPRVLEYRGSGDGRGPGGNRFTHHHCLMGQVQRSDLPRALHWVLCDVNLAPQVAFQTIRRMVAHPRRALCGVLLTLKLDTWKAMRHLPRWRTQIEAMGMVEVDVAQLPSNRLELFAYGLTAAGAARRSA